MLPKIDICSPYIYTKTCIHTHIHTLQMKENGRVGGRERRRDEGRRRGKMRREEKRGEEGSGGDGEGGARPASHHGHLN